MIVLDTHVWIWWVHGDKRLTKTQADAIKVNEADLVGVIAISCWEIAKLVERKRLELPWSLADWFEHALSYPGVGVLELTPAVAIESTRLPGSIHRDPADQIIVATARQYDCPLLTSDRKLLDYPHVPTVG